MQSDQKARDIFWGFACSHFHMDREGATDEYIKAGGRSEKEIVWRREYIELELQKVRGFEIDALHHLSTAHAIEAIPRLLEVREFEDDYFRFWYAFTLLDIVSSGQVDLRHETKTKDIVRRICAELITGPIHICPKNRKKINAGMLSALKASTAEEYVKNYAQSLKKKAEQDI